MSGGCFEPATRSSRINFAVRMLGRRSYLATAPGIKGQSTDLECHDMAQLAAPQVGHHVSCSRRSHGSITLIITKCDFAGHNKLN